jgi:hypothetical protein
LALAYRLTRRQVVNGFTTADYAYYQAADELGLWPDPIMETAKLRATMAQVFSAGRRLISLADFLPDSMVPSGPDPEADRRAMDSFVVGLVAMRSRNK